MRDWIKITLHTTTQANDLLCARLIDFGIHGFEIHDPEEYEEFLEHKEGNWDYIDDEKLRNENKESTVTVYIPENSDGFETIALIKEMIAGLKAENTDNFYGTLAIDSSDIKEEDWANNWKKYFRPFAVGNKLLVKPSWEHIENTDNRSVLEIDPGSSFGTGQHYTTHMCLEFLEKNLNAGDRVLDVGTGSGILGIAADLLGASSVTAVDVDANATETARRNFAKNGISQEKYSVYFGNILKDKKLVTKLGTNYDLITANIVADVLIAMADLFYGFLKPNGKLIISGIIIEREQEVINAVTKAGFKLVSTKENEGWAAGYLIKN